MTDKTFLGTGWKFPPSFDPINHTVRMSSGLEDIQESINIILHTTPGERLMQPDFGCFLKKLVFEKVDTQLATELNDMIYHSLLAFEPRIKNVSTRIMDTDPIGGMLKVEISFEIIITNTRHNIVFPFYYTEGTNVDQ